MYVKNIYQYWILKESDVDIKKDDESGENVVDKTKLSKLELIKIYSRELYDVSYQLISNDLKLDKELQNAKNDEEAEQIQTLYAAKAENLMNIQMELETKLMELPGNNEKLIKIAQTLSGEAKLLANNKLRDEIEKSLKN